MGMGMVGDRYEEGERGKEKEMERMPIKLPNQMPIMSEPEHST